MISRDSCCRGVNFSKIISFKEVELCSKPKHLGAC